LITYSNECCSCAVPGYPCLGDQCYLRNYPHYICDCCGDEVEPGQLFWFEGQQLCIDCVINELEVVEP